MTTTASTWKSVSMTGYRQPPQSDRHIVHLDAVEALARLHYRRIKDADSSLQGAAAALRALPALLRHLRVEAGDQDSLLNRDPERYSVARLLHPLIEETNLVLHELGEVMDQGDKVQKDGYGNREDVRVFERETDRIENRLLGQKRRIQKLLDEVQLRGSPPPTPPKAQNLDAVKDKLDEIAARLFKRRGSNFGEAGENLWEQLSIGLEREGFDRDVLRRNKEVLRAYVRSLETSILDEESRQPPSVRGLLKQEQRALPAPPLSPMASPAVAKASTFPFDRHLSSPRPCSSPRQSSTALSLDTSGDDNVSSSSGIAGDSMALISTRDLLESDRQDHRTQELLLSEIGGLHLYPPPLRPAQDDNHNYVFSPGTSPRPNFPLPTPRPHLPPAAQDQLPATGLRRDQPLELEAQSDDFVTLPCLRANLAPDSRGEDIAMEARWTRIRRSLVSPQVLDRAGVRYEARPTFVAVLGALSKEKISEFARETAEVRARRNRRSYRSRTFENDQRHRETRIQERAFQWETKSCEPKADCTVDDESDTSSDIEDSTSDNSHKARKPESRRYSRGSKPDEAHDNKFAHKDEGDPRSSNVFLVDPKDDTSGPSSSSAPKPILKNKNENKVRFGRDGPFEIPASGSLSESPRDRRRRDSERKPDRDRDLERRDRDRDRDRDRVRERDRDRRDNDRGHRDNRSYKDRDLDRYRDREKERRQKQSDLIRAAGIGGAAASLLSVLAEAAVGL